MTLRSWGLSTLERLNSPISKAPLISWLDDMITPCNRLESVRFCYPTMFDVDCISKMVRRCFEISSICNSICRVWTALTFLQAFLICWTAPCSKQHSNSAIQTSPWDLLVPGPSMSAHCWMTRQTASATRDHQPAAWQDSCRALLLTSRAQ